MNGIREVQTCEDAQVANHIIGIETKVTGKTRVCRKCGIEKPLNEFRPCQKSRMGRRSECKSCHNKYEVLQNKEPIKKNAKSKYSRQYRKKHQERIQNQQSQWVKRNPSKVIQYRQAYRATHPRNRKKEREYSKKWAKENLEKTRAYRRKSMAKIIATPRGKLNCRISTAINGSLVGNKNGRHWESLVGYTLDKLKKHLEKQFISGMTWENYGRNGWHIDHKIPVSVFNFTQPEHKDFKRCWALKNLQPMWESENISKSNKITKHFQPSLLL